LTTHLLDYEANKAHEAAVAAEGVVTAAEQTESRTAQAAAAHDAELIAKYRIGQQAGPR
jgi:hypothetical protein